LLFARVCFILFIRVTNKALTRGFVEQKQKRITKNSNKARNRTKTLEKNTKKNIRKNTL